MNWNDDVVNTKTNLWSLPKQKWFDGPTTPDKTELHGFTVDLTPDLRHFCLVSVNDSVFYIFGLDRKNQWKRYTASYDLVSKSWKSHKPSPLLNDSHVTTVRDCVHHVTKQLEK